MVTNKLLLGAGVVLFGTCSTVAAFAAQGIARNTGGATFFPSTRLSPTTWALHQSSDPSPLDNMSEERKQNLFQSLLRDLQIEGVPLLGCDANQVHTMSAALWTTMSELSENDEEQRACLVLEDIPIGALQAFVDDFLVLKTQGRLMANLKEMSRISVSLVGKGVGPALLIETTTRTEEEKAEKNARAAAVGNPDEGKCTAAVKQFVDRMVIKEQTCPYTKTPDIAGVGLEAQGVTPSAVAYRFSATTDACGALSAFWNSVCELIATPENQLSTTLLSLPGIGSGQSAEAHDRFAAVVEIVGRYLCLYRGDGMFGLVHFHPAYERNLIEPKNSAAYGHLPPQSWLRPMLTKSGNLNEAENFTDEQMDHSNYQRRSPHTVINILRVSQLNAAAGPLSIFDLDLGDGKTEKASGLVTYTRNAIRLGNIDKATLDAAVDAEVAMTK